MSELSYKSRRRLSLLVLLVWLPLYIILAIPLLSMITNWNIWLRVIIYIAAAFIWVLPFRFVFKGVGRADPEENVHSHPDSNSKP